MVSSKENQKKLLERLRIKEVLKNLLNDCQTQEEFEGRCRLLFPVESIRVGWQPKNAPRVRFVEMEYDVNEKMISVSVKV